MGAYSAQILERIPEPKPQIDRSPPYARSTRPYNERETQFDAGIGELAQLRTFEAGRLPSS